MIYVVDLKVYVTKVSCVWHEPQKYKAQGNFNLNDFLYNKKKLTQNISHENFSQSFLQNYDTQARKRDGSFV